jgi:PKD repeat protein
MKALLMISACLVMLAITVTGCVNQAPASPPGSPTQTPSETPVITPSLPVPTATILPEPTESPTPSPAVSLPPPPIASFTATPVSGKAPLTVHFMDTSTGSPTGWVWDFGDNASSSLQNPTHIYTSAGTFTVRLRASNSGGSNTETRYYYITVNPEYVQPGAAFSANPPTMAQPYTVQFLDRSSGPPTNWSWNFGDGGTSTEQNPVHTYPGPGTFIVTLKVSNPAGSTKTTGYVTLG